MRFIRLAAFAATGLLCACGQVMDQMATIAATHEPTLVIRPEYEVMIDGRPTKIVGEDQCPAYTGVPVPDFYFIGGIPNSGERGCTILGKERSDVLVRMVMADSRVQTERWTIVRGTVEKDGRTFPTTGLRRPGGAAVIPVANP